jgi:hypothetical protein
MELDAHAGRALSALVFLAMLAAVGCKEDEPTSGENTAGDDGNEGPRDAGGSGGEVIDPRMHSDGAVQLRAEPEEPCELLNAAGSAYFFCPSLLPYTMAVGSCWAAGSTLVTINDADENQALVDEMVDDEYWIGFNDAAVEESWTWAAGSEGSSYENWDEGEPANADFAFIRRESGRWAASTDDPRPYICEIWH